MQKKLKLAVLAMCCAPSAFAQTAADSIGFHSVEIKLFLSRCSESDAEEQGEDKKILFHFSYLLFYSCFV